VSKISLTVAVGQSAKTQIVKEHGIGEELAMNVFGWLDDRLVCVAAMDKSWNSDDDKKIMRTLDTCRVLRRGWHCDSFTLLAEGFMSRYPEKTKHLDLIDAYFDPNNRVNECLTVNYVSIDETYLCAIPFRIGFAKKVEWGPMVHSSDLNVLRNNKYVIGAQSILSDEIYSVPVESESFFMALALGIHENNGFFVQYDF